MKTVMIAIIIFLLFAGCGPAHDSRRYQPNPHDQAWIVQSRSSVQLNITTHLGLTTWVTTNNDTTDVVNVTMNGSSSMTLSTANFAVPTMTSDLLSFGSLDISQLRDNKLKVCGTGHTKCTAAAIRVYTSGQSGAGFWNSVDSYGAPLNVAVGTDTYSATGLDDTGADYVEQINIPSNKNVINLSDFTYPSILVQGDFTNAGEGSYSTTINVEFVVGQ